MKPSFYLHAWQGVLMFLFGILCVLASFGGYLMSGGGEELLRRALLNVTSGNASYESLTLNWRKGRIEVTNMRHEDFAWPKDHPIAHLKNLVAPKVFVQLSGWPARVDGIEVQGVSEAAIEVDEGFLQQGALPDQKAPRNFPPIRFLDCNLKVALGGAPPLALNGCQGQIERDAEGRLRGGFSLHELNGAPFELTVETLENGRWVVTGNKIQLDTKVVKAAKNPFASKIDPVGLLVKALFSGEMGAQGTLNSLHVSVQPATELQSFACEGEVGYSNLTLQLPPAAGKAGKALPFFLGMLLGVDEKHGANFWPQLIHIDQITTGERGRVAFHMADGRLDFSCDEGAGSAFTAMRDGLPFPAPNAALEALKGSVETDASSLPKRIVLRGFFGSQVSFETRVALGEDRSRVTELLLQPRSGDAARLDFGRSLWRFESRVKDYVSVPNRKPDLALAEFEVEADVQSFPMPEWLPPGLTQLTGAMHAKGGFHNLDGKPENGRKLFIEELTWDDGGVVVSGANPRKPGADFHPFWEACYALFAQEKPWAIHGLSSKAVAEVYFDANLEWNRVAIHHWTMPSAVFSHEGTAIAFAPPELKLDCESKRDPAAETKTGEVSVRGNDWNVTIGGKWIHDKIKQTASGDFKYVENNVPLNLHPNRAALEQAGGAKNLRVQREFDVHVRPDGVKVKTK